MPSSNFNSICKGCPKGTWSDILGVIAEAQCQLCITGKYGQTSIGANASSSCSDCPKGKYLGTVGFQSQRMDGLISSTIFLHFVKWCISKYRIKGKIL